MLSRDWLKDAEFDLHSFSLEEPAIIYKQGEESGWPRSATHPSELLLASYSFVEPMLKNLHQFYRELLKVEQFK